MDGAQGGGTAGSGGSGYHMEKSKWLTKDSTMSFTIGKKPSSGLSTGGSSSTLSLNGSTYWIVGGGTGAVPSYDDCDKKITESTRLTIAGGYGNRNGSSGYITFHTCDKHQDGDTVYTLTSPSTCYTCTGHTHDAIDRCPRKSVTCTAGHGCGGWANCGKAITNGDGDVTGYYHKCTEGHIRSHGESMSTCGQVYSELNCGNSPDNTWKYTCTQNGQVVTQVNASPGTCYSRETPDSQSLSNSGDGSFTIWLETHENLYHANTKVQLPYYKNDPVEVVVLDNTVVYYIR